MSYQSQFSTVEVSDDQALWAIAVALFGVGDVVTTAYGLSDGGAEESNPLAESILDVGGEWGMVVTKALVFAVAYLAYTQAPAEYRQGIPLGLVLLGIAVMANNSAVITAAETW